MFQQHGDKQREESVHVDRQSWNRISSNGKSSSLSAMSLSQTKISENVINVFNALLWSEVGTMTKTQGDDYVSYQMLTNTNTF